MSERLVRAASWRVPFLALAFLLALFVVPSFSRNVARFGRVDLLVTAEAGRVEIQAVGESARALGLLANDLILLAGGQPVTDAHALLQSLAASPVDLTVMREGRLLRLTTTPSPAPWNIKYLFLAAVALCFAGTGAAAVWWVKRGSHPAANYLFGGFCLSAAVILAVSPAPPFDTLYKIQILLEETARAFLPAFLLALLFTFPRVARHPRRSLFFVPAFLLLGLTLHTYFGPQKPGESALAGIARLDLWQGLWIVAGSLAGTGRLIVLARRRIDLLTEKQIRFLLFGTVLGLLPVALLGFVPGLFGIQIPIVSTLSVLPLALLPFAFLSAITKYRLWDVELLARETAAYAGAGFLGAFFFAGVQLLAPVPLPPIPYARGVMETGAGLIIALSMLPVRRGLSSALSRVQHGERYQDRERLRALGRELLTPRRASEISRLLCDRVSAGLGVSPVALLAVDDGSVDASVVDGGHPIPLSELPAEVTSRTTRLSRQVFSLSPTAATSRLRRAGFRTLAPLAVSGRLLALFAAGDRPGRGPLSTDDLELLEEILAPAALALDHARLYNALEEEARRYRTLKEFHEDVVSGSAAAIAATDDLGRLSSVNPAFCRLLDRSESDLLFQPVSACLPQEVLSVEGSARQSVVLGGREAVLDVAVSPFPGATPGSPARVFVIHNATEIARLEKALSERERLAALSSLSAGVAHEVNTPLTGVASFARLVLDDTPEDDPRRPLLEKIEEQAFRASRLISSLLDLARGKPRDVSRLSAVDLAEEAVRSVSDEASAKRVTVSLAASSARAVLAGHGDALIQVLVNILKNGIEAVAARRADQRFGGQVSIAISEESGRVLFRIEDDGPGLPDSLRDRIFEPFTSTKTGQGGVGLGLAIASDIVKAHGGSISAEAVNPRGTRFVVSLPAIP